jgi:Glucosamine 6-phosphate synthetase, contains amidotransferase and phosphosugar isomerase domains
MCCLFGLIDYAQCLSAKRKEKIIKVLSRESEVRGTHATGVAYLTGDKMTIFKRPKAAHSMHFKFDTNPQVIMGHCRFTTQGTEKNNENNHPFYSRKLDFALAHNGILYNDVILRQRENIPKPSIETDSYIAVQLIEQKNTLNFDSLKFMAEKVEGSFCFTVLDSKNNIYLIKGDNPLAIVDAGGYYIYASTETILASALKKLGIYRFEQIKINEGEIMRIDRNGKRIKDTFTISDNLYGMPYSCSWSRYGGYYNCGGYYTGKPKAKTENEYIKQYTQDLIDYAAMVGIDEDTIINLINDGFSLDEIENMIYEHEYYYEMEGFDDAVTEI